MNGLFDDVWGTQERIVSDHVVDVTLPVSLASYRSTRLLTMWGP